VTLRTRTLQIGPPTPRIVFDVNTGAPTGPPHFAETTVVLGPMPESTWLDADNGSFAIAKGGGFDFANSGTGDWGKKDGFDAPVEQLDVDPLLVTAVNVHVRYSSRINYVDSPYATEFPISDPPVGLIGMFLRPSGNPGYRGTFSDGFVSSEGWIELHRIGCTSDLLIHEELSAVPGTQLDEGLLAKLNMLTSTDTTMTVLVAGASASEVATITIYDLWLEVVWDAPDEIPEIDIEDGSSQFMRTY
jgi:hypothetical protein